MASEPPKTSPKDMDTRVIGCLMGQAVGDALGTRYEFSKSGTTKAGIKKDTDSSGHLQMLGQGPFNLVPGQVTDDTELALALARSLVRCKTFNVYDIAKSYATWYNSPPFDIGITTRRAFGMAKLDDEPQDIYETILSSSERGNQGSLSNGCLMRISPLAIAGTQWSLETLQLAAQMDCQLTNPNPVALDAVKVYVTALRTALLTGDIMKTYECAFKAADTDDIRDLLTAATERAQPIVLNNGKEVTADSQFMGYLGVALQLTFYELLHGNDFEHALVNIIGYGGDTDTNGAIAGALFGAIYGYGGIPADWADTVLNAKTDGRVSQYPWVQTSDLPELAILLLETEEPVFSGDFEEDGSTSSSDEEGEGY
jgi:ADP-ribosyl-[dinitrogen reductase] hydrolase